MRYWYPTRYFTTNPNESINALLKHKLDYKKSEMSKFIEKVKELSLEQIKEDERAVINRGKYQFGDEYKFLEIPESKWFTMSIQQRKHRLTKVHFLAVVNYTSVQESSNHGTCTSQLAMTMESAAKGLNVPLTCVEGIWRKATGLINDTNAVVPDLGQSKEAQMVLKL